MLSIKALASRFSLSCRNQFFRNLNHVDSRSTFALKFFLTSVATELEAPSIPRPNRRPLDVVFKEALGLCGRSAIPAEQSSSNGVDDDLKRKLSKLEMALRQLKEERREKTENDVKVSRKCEPKRIIQGGEGVVLKETSPDMQLLLRHLYYRGYFNGANFLRRNDEFELELSYFDEEYARDFVKCAVERFGRDNQHVSAWLSGSDLKTLALFGCPSLKKREVFAAKRLRNYFKIPEETVCCNCTLKDSCKFVNQSVWKGDTKELRVDLLMRVLRTYSLEDVPHGLRLTDDLKACVSRLMHDILNLSKP